MNLIEEMLKLLPVIETALTGGVLEDIEAAVTGLTSLFESLKATTTAAAATTGDTSNA